MIMAMGTATASRTFRPLMVKPLDRLAEAVVVGTGTNVDVTVERTRCVEVPSSTRLVSTEVVSKLMVDSMEEMLGLCSLFELGALAADAELVGRPLEEMLELRSPLGLEIADGFAAIAEETDGANSNLLLKEPQHVPVPVASQQKPPSGMTESWHSTTNLFGPLLCVSQDQPDNW